MSNQISLADLGWQHLFQQQLTLEEWGVVQPARIVEQHKSTYEILTESGKQVLAVTPSMPKLTVGDWLLLDSDKGFLRDLERFSCFRRVAAGTRVSEQLIAANVDVAFIVCSLNEDFNLNRIERYLAIVNEAGAEPVVVLSKTDLCEAVDDYRSQVQKLDNFLCVEAVNCLDEESVSVLMPWCQSGKTIVMLGSSGSGKSTLSNTLLGNTVQKTGAIREDDDKGRHTTTSRSLLSMPNGAMILDTPGMRELQLTDCEQGVSATFSDIEALAEECRFADCRHEREPHCAVQKAIDEGRLDERRFKNYQKLMREQALNGASLAERRASGRKLTQYYKRVLKETKSLNGK